MKSQKSTVTQQNITQFVRLSDEISQLGRKAGVTIRPYNDPSLPIFSGLQPAKQLSVLRVLSNQRDFFAIADDENLPLDSIQLVWRTLNRMGMTPSSDIFDRISNEDTVEVYDSDGVPSFKNLIFFKFISMTLEEIFSLPWHQQMTASPQLIAYFIEMGARLKIFGFKKTFAPRFSEYSFFEKLGNKNHIHIHLKWISPVKGKDGANSLLFVNRSKRLPE